MELSIWKIKLQLMKASCTLWNLIRINYLYIARSTAQDMFICMRNNQIFWSCLVLFGHVNMSEDRCKMKSEMGSNLYLHSRKYDIVARSPLMVQWQGWGKPRGKCMKIEKFFFFGGITSRASNKDSWQDRLTSWIWLEIRCSNSSTTLFKTDSTSCSKWKTRNPIKNCIYD